MGKDGTDFELVVRGDLWEQAFSMGLFKTSLFLRPVAAFVGFYFYLFFFSINSVRDFYQIGLFKNDLSSFLMVTEVHGAV